MAKRLNTVAMVGQAGRVVINASDVGRYRARGYKLEGEKPQKSADNSSKTGENPNSSSGSGQPDPNAAPQANGGNEGKDEGNPPQEPSKSPGGQNKRNRG